MSGSYDHLLLGETRYWRVYLHEQQGYIGRVYVWAKRDGVIDPCDLTLWELVDLWRLVRRIKHALTMIFKPDLFNYACFANEAPHCHVHIIPRYKQPVEFNGRHFHDTRWGKNYAPYPKASFSAEMLESIRQAILQAF